MARGITELDTAASYHHGKAHQLLASAASELLPQFRISTKITPRAGWPPLHEQAARCTAELGLTPDVVLLHNPEHVLHQLPGPASQQRWWAVTAVTMAELAAQGACRTWGIACWDPRPLVPALAGTAGQAPPPEVVMTRAGLLVPAPVRRAIDALTDQLPAAARWGMSPLAGQPRLLDDIPLDGLLDEEQPAASRWQIATAAAWHLPPVSRLAVGASNPQHLDELVTATLLPLNHERLSACQNLLAAAG